MNSQSNPRLFDDYKSLGDIIQSSTERTLWILDLCLECNGKNDVES